MEEKLEIRQAVKDAGLKLWQVAERMGIQDPALSRLSRHELCPEGKNKIQVIINQLRNEVRGE